MPDKQMLYLVLGCHMVMWMNTELGLTVSFPDYPITALVSPDELKSYAFIEVDFFPGRSKNCLLF